MKGMNHLTFCIAELEVAIQEYLDKRWTVDTPVVDSITLETSSMADRFIKVMLKDHAGIDDHK